MFEQLVSMATSHLGDNLSSNEAIKGLGVDHQNVAGVAGNVILQTLMGQLQNNDTSALQEMLSGTETSQNSPAVSSLMPSVVSQLGSQLNLSSGTAQSIAAVAIPLIMNMLNGRVNQAQQGGMDIGGMLGGLMGGGNASGGGGGLLGSVLGGLMGGGNAAPQQKNSAQDMLGSLLGNILK